MKKLKRSAKGKERSNQLVAAAKALLEHDDLATISMHRIAAEAGIPASSAYHFFDGPSDVFAALAQQFGRELMETIVAPYSGPSLESWHRLYHDAVLRAVELYRANPAYCPLILGRNTTPAIKSADRENDFEIGRQFTELLDSYFVLPEIEARETRMFHSIEIVDLFLSLSYQTHGTLEPDMVEDGIAAALAYLKLFIPERLPRRPDH